MNSELHHQDKYNMEQNICTVNSLKQGGHPSLKKHMKQILQDLETNIIIYSYVHKRVIYRYQILRKYFQTILYNSKNLCLTLHKPSLYKMGKIIQMGHISTQLDFDVQIGLCNDGSSSPSQRSPIQKALSKAGQISY